MTHKLLITAAIVAIAFAPSIGTGTAQARGFGWRFWRFPWRRVWWWFPRWRVSRPRFYGGYGRGLYGGYGGFYPGYYGYGYPPYCYYCY